MRCTREKFPFQKEGPGTLPGLQSAGVGCPTYSPPVSGRRRGRVCPPASPPPRGRGVTQASGRRDSAAVVGPAEDEVHSLQSADPDAKVGRQGGVSECGGRGDKGVGPSPGRVVSTCEGFPTRAVATVGRHGSGRRQSWGPWRTVRPRSWGSRLVEIGRPVAAPGPVLPLLVLPRDLGGGVWPAAVETERVPAGAGGVRAQRQCARRPGNNPFGPPGSPRAL